MSTMQPPRQRNSQKATTQTRILGYRLDDCSALTFFVGFSLPA